VVVQGDRARLERTVDNLLANATKYSPPGAPVEVEVSRQDGRVRLTVRDRGVGIPPAELRRIFRPGYRASTASGVPGSGLGLAAVQAVVRAHGGQVAVESTVGATTTVEVRLPCR
jgi:two-component system sensor histidine kinase MprB